MEGDHSLGQNLTSLMAFVNQDSLDLDNHLTFPYITAEIVTSTFVSLVS